MRAEAIDFRHADPHRKVDSFSYLRLSDIGSLSEVLALLDRLREGEPEAGFLCTLDDVGQCCYTSGHAGDGDRIRFDCGEVDFDDPLAVHAWEAARLEHVAAQLQKPQLQSSWDEVAGTLDAGDEDIRALLAMNRDPDAVLDTVVYVQRLPVARDDLLIAGLPNGYFTCDWDVFQNHAVIRHLHQRYAYRFFGIGASWLGFVREQVLQADQADRLAAELRRLYGQADASAQDAVWRELSSTFQRSRVLLLGYTENFAG